MTKRSNLKKIKKREQRVKKRLILIVCLCIFVFSSNMILLISVPSLANKHDADVSDVQVKKKEDEEKDSKILELEKLYEENNDVYGYLIIPNTQIDYLVMYTPGEDTYLRKDFNKNYLEAGMLYVDKHNNVSPRDTNLIIYGHNMNDGTMFHDLLNYKNKEYYENHKTFTFYTLEEKQEYEIIAVFLSKVYRVNDEVFKYYKFYNAENEEEYNDYINNVKKLSLYDTGVTAKYGDELFTFSTCEYSQENGRMVVVSKRIDK